MTTIVVVRRQRVKELFKLISGFKGLISYTFRANKHRKFISVISQLDAQNFCFTISLFHTSTCFKHMCFKHVEVWNKLIVKQKFRASSWLITEINILRWTVSKTSKHRSYILWKHSCLNLKWHWKVPLVFVWLAVFFILLALSMFPYNANCKCKY